jgi:hypothetical protein
MRRLGGVDFRLSPFSCSPARKNLYGGGGVKFKTHVNNLSENIFFVKFNCTRIRRQNRVGGYMKGKELKTVERQGGLLIKT